jgi:hypothetical protein
MRKLIDLGNKVREITDVGHFENFQYIGFVPIEDPRIETPSYQSEVLKKLVENSKKSIQIFPRLRSKNVKSR